MADEQPTTTTRISLDQGEMVGRIKSKMQAFRVERDQARAEHEEAKKEIERLKKDLDSHPDRKRAQALEQEIRTTRHRKMFDKVAKEKGVREDGLDDLYSLSGYKPETDIPDEAAVTAVIESQQKQRAYLFADPDAPQKPPEPKPGPGSGQGGKPGSGTTGFQLPAQDDPRWSDVRWQMEHWDEIADASSERRRNGVV